MTTSRPGGNESTETVEYPHTGQHNPPHGQLIHHNIANVHQQRDGDHRHDSPEYREKRKNVIDNPPDVRYEKYG